MMLWSPRHLWEVIMAHGEHLSLGTARDKPARTVTDVRAALNFIRRQDTKPVFHSAALTGGDPKIFFDVEPHTVPILDMRQIAGTLSVDKEGFELLHHATAVDDLHDDDAIEAVYYPEIEALLRRKRFSDLRTIRTSFTS